jgi:hypothetical protein
MPGELGVARRRVRRAAGAAHGQLGHRRGQMASEVDLGLKVQVQV